MKFKDFVFILIVILVPLCLNLEIFTGDFSHFLYHDNLPTHYPMLLEAFRQWSHGQIPLWQSYWGGGGPLLADINSMSLYPLSNLFFLFTQSASVISLIALFHIILSGLFTYLFLKELGLKTESALFGAMIYSLNGFMQYIPRLWIQWVCAMSWLPLSMFSVERYSKADTNKAKWLILNIFAISMTFLAGYPSHFIFSILVLTSYTVIKGLFEDQKVKFYYVYFIVMISAVLLVAIQFVPTYEFFNILQGKQLLLF
jgi:hypothetical protein